MKRFLAPILALLALPLAAQTSPAAVPHPAASTDSQKVVAVINGETISLEQLNRLYDRLGTQMKDQYEKTGGKPAFLENYLRKRLIVQEALKSGFDKRPDVQADMEAAKDSVLFDRYARDVIGGQIVTDDMIRKYYDEHTQDFQLPETIKVRHIIITANGAGPNPKTKEQALEKIQQISAELHSENLFPNTPDQATIDHLVLRHFADAAAKYSEDGSASSGGDLGWVSRGSLDPTFEDAAFGLKKGSISGIVETRYGYHLIMVEDRKPAGVEPFETARPKVREFLMTQYQSDVVQAVTKVTNELKASSKISVFPENIR